MLNKSESLFSNCRKGNKRPFTRSKSNLNNNKMRKNFVRYLNNVIDKETKKRVAICIECTKFTKNNKAEI